ncbi:FH1/FH2 domain-containing protein 3 [Araneus ventricosus]|uniref:FH1/FH2 domain-containing protein 3 n=1 Tax=Araneus ventricosus TaxID=182803 RepID=A0A4Y2T4W3_ARAVE|nr:FH1/FH2 domain-containing protein 3 [Araneus ventricosus]
MECRKLACSMKVNISQFLEKLLNSTGRELRRALFSLKQIFQDDKDLVHEFVQNDGLACLIKVGSEADQNYQNYILRALGQVMLYVDGMNGVIEHIETIQWLYSLISSKYRLVVKTALKLLLVFVEYSDSNSLLLMNTVNLVDSEKGNQDSCEYLSSKAVSSKSKDLPSYHAFKCFFREPNSFGPFKIEDKTVFGLLASVANLGFRSGGRGEVMETLYRRDGCQASRLK